MLETNLTNETASKYLGKSIAADGNYNPDLLVAVPRCENRSLYDINSDDLPFVGFDVWHCYEFSALTDSNLPLTRVLKLKYPCESEYIVESKSLKLYFNSFNMTKMGSDIATCLDNCKNIIENDLSKKLNTSVEVNFLSEDVVKKDIFADFENLYNLLDYKSLNIKNFKESPQILKYKQTSENSVYKLKFNSLRSNCRVTHQPDFGDVYIYYKSNKRIDYNSLAEYLVSFRCENHFHEECCEMIFKRLYDILDKTDELMVCALYTRRGGIDISPVRYTKNITDNSAADLIDIAKFARCGIKQ